MKASKMTLIYPTTGKIVKKNSTHVAMRTATCIQIWILGFTLEDLNYAPEHLYDIELSRQDDLFAIFEELDEENRCNMAAAKMEFGF